MYFPPYDPPLLLQNGVAITIYTSLWGSLNWKKSTKLPEPPYQEQIFLGAQNVPIFGWVAIPKNAHSTIIGTYGITGDLENQWFLRLLGRKAYALGYAVVLFDWRAHGKTAGLSPTITSDGLYEKEDFIRIAATASTMGCPRKFWFTGYSLGGQLALWATKAATALSPDLESIGISEDEIEGAAVICPNLDSRRSLSYLVSYPAGRYFEARITQSLKQLAWRIHDAHPGSLDPQAIKRANSIWDFDRELVIERLGFSSVEAYYEATSALPLLTSLSKPTLIIYAQDDPFFEPAIATELPAICTHNPKIDLLLTRHGGHVGYLSSKKCQSQAQDPDQWWAWNRILQWLECKRKDYQ
jgi:predicted alpha/beta-fold hydrolase